MEQLLIINSAKSVSGIYLYADWLEEQGRYEEAFYLKIGVELDDKGFSDGVAHWGQVGHGYGSEDGNGVGYGMWDGGWDDPFINDYESLDGDGYGGGYGD